MKLRPGVGIVSCWFGVVLSVAAQVLAICPKCGREAKSADAAFCAKCGAAYAVKTLTVEEPVVVTQKVEAPAQLSEFSTGVLEAVRADVAAARKVQQVDVGRAVAEQYAQAVLVKAYYRNAAALLRLVPSEAQAMAMVAALQDELAKVPDMRRLKLDEARRLSMQSHQRFESEERLLGRMSASLVWYPSVWKLSIEQLALLKTAVPPSCLACAGLSVEMCPKCKGTALVECTYPGCKAALAKAAQGENLFAIRRLDLPFICPTCQNSGRMACQDCKSTGVVSCKKCSGSGTTMRCPQCVGEGLQACVKCGNINASKGQVCPVCHGERKIFCTGCKGCGYLSK